MFCKKVVLGNFAKFTGKDLCQSLFFNNVASLRPATLLKKRLWHLCFPVSFAKFLRTPFLNRTPLVAASEPVRLSAINTIFSCKKVPQKFRSSHRRCSVKEGLLLERGPSTAKFLRALILKNICERLLLKISISVINSEAVAQRCSVKKMFLEISQNSQ